jgi:hypothetical protein
VTSDLPMEKSRRSRAREGANYYAFVALNRIAVVGHNGIAEKHDRESCSEFENAPAPFAGYHCG